ncbi:DUF5082 family protein [Sporosarcina sp. HYO08]|uniref:YwqH-like family protein n=1 Tax=Sporosarcina sp. HYO08 TaxID=1759557 RepID=UPI00079815C5|nr:DUF5082 family protein [Sporosarcina sp. HYO08]KXH78556.1 hypothetical protein AU377_12820 [Sporosarcina sp. HYO08]
MIAYYINLKAKKLKEIERLNACKSSLQSKQGEFNDNEHKCLEPELTTATWHGQHASEFEDIREAGIHTPYLEIAGAQFAKVYDAIATKIAALQAEVISIQQTIDRLLAEQAARRARATQS